MTPMEFIEDVEYESIKYASYRITPFKFTFLERVFPRTVKRLDLRIGMEINAWHILTEAMRHEITDSVTAALTR